MFDSIKYQQKNKKMRKILLSLIVTFLTLSLYSQEKYMTRNGNISFSSDTPLEKIKGTNKHVVCILNMENGELVFQMKIISFEFKKALLEEHFNEKYMESEEFTRSTFSGKIDNWENVNLEEGKIIDVSVEGVIEVHGIKKTITTDGKLQLMNGNIHLLSAFSLKISDFNIKISGVVKDKIAKSVDVSVDIILNKM